MRHRVGIARKKNSLEISCIYQLSNLIFFVGSSSHFALHPFVHNQRTSTEREGVERMFELFSYRGQVLDHR